LSNYYTLNSSTLDVLEKEVIERDYQLSARRCKLVRLYLSSKEAEKAGRKW